MGHTEEAVTSSNVDALCSGLRRVASEHLQEVGVAPTDAEIEAAFEEYADDTGRLMCHGAIKRIGYLQATES